MPKARQPREVWAETRRRIFKRDGGKCNRCATPLTLRTAHVDHIKSGKMANNEDGNLRLLCRRCHVLRSDKRHRGMISKALADGIIPPDWRKLVWEG